MEFIFIFSCAASFLILAILKGGEKEEIENSPGSQRHLFESFRILNLFLKLDLDAAKKTAPLEIDTAGLDNPLITNIVNFKKAEKLLLEGKTDEIPKLLDRINGRYGFIIFKREELYLKYLYHEKRFKDFIQRCSSAAAPRRDFELQLLLINSLLETNKEAKAFNLFKELFQTRNLHQFKQPMSSRHLALLLSKLTYEDWYRKLYFLVKNNRYPEFLAEKIYVKDPQLIDLIQAEFHYQRGQYSRAKRLLSGVKADKLLNQKKKILIKIELRINGPKDILKNVKELKGDRELYAELLVDTASILLLKGDPESSLQLFSKYIRLKNIGSPDYYKALWVTAWIHYRNGNKKKGGQYFEKGAHSHLIPYKIANLYWLHRLGKTSAKELENYPFSYYYVKIAEKKGKNKERIPAGSSRNFSRLISGPQGQNFVEIIRDLKTLLAYRLVAESFQFLEWVLRYERLSLADRNMLKLIESILYLKQQRHYKAFINFRNNFPCYQCIVLPAALSHIYLPIKYRDLIDQYADLYQLDPLLILALIREETLFKADAVSPARALGLMQLLYRTARKVALGEGIKRLSRRDLFIPELNIRLGSKFFKTLLDKYSGQLHLALAAYNAGDHRVDRWLREFGDMEPEAFIEMIPFSDTRTYVKNIFRNYYYYKYYLER